MEPVRELAQLLDGDQQLPLRAIEDGRGLLGSGPLLVGGEAQVHDERRQALLRAVVEVAQQPPPLDLGRLDQPRAGRAQAGAERLALRYDRGQEQGR